MFPVFTDVQMGNAGIEVFRSVKQDGLIVFYLVGCDTAAVRNMHLGFGQHKKTVPSSGKIRTSLYASDQFPAEKSIRLLVIFDFRDAFVLALLPGGDKIQSLHMYS